MITVIDVSVSSRPWRYAHIYISLIYGNTYVAFQLIYILGFNGTDANGNDYIYPVLDWKNDPGTAVIWVVLVLVVLFFAQGFLCLLAFARDKLWEQFLGKSPNKVAALELTSVKSYDSMKR